MHRKPSDQKAHTYSNYAQNFTEHRIAGVNTVKVIQQLFLLHSGQTLTVAQDRRSPGTT